jgi:hypothetical protein
MLDIRARKIILTCFCPKEMYILVGTHTNKQSITIQCVTVSDGFAGATMGGRARRKCQKIFSKY